MLFHACVVFNKTSLKFHSDVNNMNNKIKMVFLVMFMLLKLTEQHTKCLMQI